jgi:hypothetical protein
LKREGNTNEGMHRWVDLFAKFAAYTYQDYFMSLNGVCAVVAAEGDVEELAGLSKLPETGRYCCLEIVPPCQRRVKSLIGQNVLDTYAGKQLS